MVSKHKFSKSNLTTIVVGFGILIPATLIFAQDEIDEPAGDIATAIEDSEPGADTSLGQSSSEDDSQESVPGDIEQNPEPDSTATSGEAEEGQIGPVWDSYNDNMKSVAQEVTKGLRVEDVVEPPTEYHYAAFGKPDPFVAPMLARESLATASAISGLEVPIVSPLQRHEIKELKLVGIWQLRSGERKALILTPQSSESASDAGIIVRNGDSVGNRAGKILAIGDTFLTVREFKLAVDGTRQYEDIQMLMGARDPSATPGKIKFTPGEAKTEVILEGEQQAVPVVNSQDNKGTQTQNAAPNANGQSGLMARSTAPVAAPVSAPIQANPVGVEPASTAVPAAKKAQPISDPRVTGIAPVAGQPLPPDMNGTAPPPIPTQPTIKSPYIPAP
jgi:Tfp pilus assembly protein PilP